MNRNPWRAGGAAFDFPGAGALRFLKGPGFDFDFSGKGRLPSIVPIA
jgi:hypothetical protein